MNILVTGGAGFIGRWVTKKLLKDGHNVWIIDNLSNSSKKNIEEFSYYENFQEFIEGDITDKELLLDLFQKYDFALCFHLAASINVQDSIDDPETTFHNDTVGTFWILECCRKHNTKLVFMSTCMVYAASNRGIRESDPIKPASPYAGSKIAAESMVLSYHHAYNLPVVILRPFNTYGPFQKTNGEGGVVSIFIQNHLDGKPLQIYGDGTQTRDLLYVEDCADFVVKAGYSYEANGHIIHAGTGRDISINELALMIAENPENIVHVPHIHPQSEIMKLQCDYDKARILLNWHPKVSLEEGIERTKEWIESMKDS